MIKYRLLFLKEDSIEWCIKLYLLVPFLRNCVLRFTRIKKLTFVKVTCKELSYIDFDCVSTVFRSSILKVKVIKTFSHPFFE